VVGVIGYCFNEVCMFCSQRSEVVPGWNPFRRLLFCSYSERSVRLLFTSVVSESSSEEIVVFLRPAGAGTHASGRFDGSPISVPHLRSPALAIERP
jgi:hypothetical protein